MPNVLWTDVKGLKPPKLDKMVELRETAFIKKLRVSDTSDGLRIKPMQGAADPRARTGRVSEGWRAVLFRLDGSDGVRTYVYAGTWPHDEGIQIAKSRVLQGNPVNGIGEFIDTSMTEWSPAAENLVVAQASTVSFLTTNFNYSKSDLVDVLGFDAPAADALLGVADEDELLSVAAAFPNAWQQHAALALGLGHELGKIRLELGIDAAPEAEPHETEDDRILRSLRHPAAKMQFTFIESDEALERIIEGGDFGAWRVFLHPEQQRYAARPFGVRSASRVAPAPERQSSSFTAPGRSCRRMLVHPSCSPHTRERSPRTWIAISNASIPRSESRPRSVLQEYTSAASTKSLTRSG